MLTKLFEHWLVLGLATIGGVTVVVGLLLELLGEKQAYPSVSDFWKCKRRRKLGEILVIIGVGVETFIAFGLTAREVLQNWEYDPIHAPLAQLSAYVDFEYKSNSLTPNPFDRKLATFPTSVTVLSGNAFIHLRQTSPAHPGIRFNNSGGPYFTYSAEYDLPAEDRTAFLNELKFMHLESPTIATLTNQVKGLLVNPVTLPEGTQILGGSIELLWNSKIEQVFKLDTQQIDKSGTILYPTNFPVQRSN